MSVTSFVSRRWLACLLVTATSLTAATAPAVEQVAKAVETDSARRFLDAVTVTATRGEHTIDEVAGTVSVIGRGEIEAQVMTDVRDLVRYEPGVYVEGSASPSGLGGFNIRGIGGNRVLTRVDGVPIAEGFEFGHFEVPPYALSLESVETVEILRGAASSLYGSDALGGVVSLVTRGPGDYLSRGRDAYTGLRVAWDGREDRRAQGITWAGRRDRWQGSVSTDHSSAGERSSQGSVRATGPSRTAPDPRSGQALGLLAKLGRRQTPSKDLELTVEVLERRSEILVLSAQGTTDLGTIFGFGPTITYLVDKPSVEAADRQQRWRLGMEQARTGGWADHLVWRLHAQSSETDQTRSEIRVTTRGGGPFGPLQTSEALRLGLMRFEQASLGGELQARQALGRRDSALLTFGTTLTRDRFDQLRDRPETDLATGETLPSSDGLVFPTKYFPESRVLEAGLYAQVELDFFGGRLRVTPAVRYDHIELGIDARDAVFLSGNRGTPPPVELEESAVSPKLGLVAALTGRYTLHALAARGFRAPPYSAVNSGFTHLAGGQTRLPNPELRAERSEGFELGLRRSGPRAGFSVTAFSNFYRDFIELVVLGLNPATGLTEFQQRNLTRARISGLEASAEIDLGPSWRLRASGAWIEGRDESRSTPLNSIHPAPQLALGLAREPKDARWRVELAGRRVGAKSASELDRSRFRQFATPSYEVLDAFAGWRISEAFAVDAGVSNLLDETYWSWASALGQTEGSISLLRHTEPGRTASITLRYRR